MAATLSRWMENCFEEEDHMRATMAEGFVEGIILKAEGKPSLHIIRYVAKQETIQPAHPSSARHQA